MTKKRRRLAAAVEALCTRRRWLWLIPLLSTTTVLALWAVRSAQDAADASLAQAAWVAAERLVDTLAEGIAWDSLTARTRHVDTVVVPEHDGHPPPGALRALLPGSPDHDACPGTLPDRRPRRVPRGGGGGASRAAGAAPC